MSTNLHSIVSHVWDICLDQDYAIWLLQLVRAKLTNTTPTVKLESLYLLVFFEIHQRKIGFIDISNNN